MPLDKYDLQQGSHGPSTVELQTFLNEKFDAGLDESKFGQFGPKTEAAVNKVLETLGMEQNGIFGPEAYEAALKYLDQKAGRHYKLPGSAGMKEIEESEKAAGKDKPEAM